MILDILTVLFFVFGFVLILRMIGERRRDVLHGPYVTKEVPANEPGGTRSFTTPRFTLLEISRAALTITRASLISASGLSQWMAARATPISIQKPAANFHRRRPDVQLHQPVSTIPERHRLSSRLGRIAIRRQECADRAWRLFPVRKAAFIQGDEIIERGEYGSGNPALLRALLNRF